MVFFIEGEKNCHKKLGFKKKQLQVPIMYSVNKCFDLILPTAIIDKHEAINDHIFVRLFFIFIL